MEKIFQFVCLKALATLVSKFVCSDCQCLFPKEWGGDWYETRLGVISSISEKGACIESRDNYYLMEDREIGCYMCLLVEHRHANVLQYKESFCSGKASLHAICSTIQQETMQHTLIRGTSAATSCPFQGAYHFNYNNNSGGTCRYPMSYAKPCAGGSRFSLHFNHCPDAAYSYARVVVLECLATWREGASKFLIGRWIYSEAIREHEEYRCFMYRLLGSVVYMSMSADGTCRGLRSSIDGPVLLELTQDTLGWPKPRCSFPAWMARTSWEDLAARRLFRANEKGDVIESYTRKTVTSPHELYKTYRCFSVLTPNISDEFISVQLTSDGCSSGYQCLRLKKKTENLLEIHEGKITEFSNGRCSEKHATSETKRILIPERTVAGRCPFDGQFYIHTGTSLCPSYLRSGCNASHVIDIVSACSKKPGMMLVCLVSWREDKKRLFVARLLGDDSGVSNCYSFTRIGDNLYFTTDSTCNLDTPYLLRDKVSYSLNQEMLPCRTHSEEQQAESARGQDSITSTAIYRMNAPEAYKDAGFSDMPVESIAGAPSHLWPEMDQEEQEGPRSRATKCSMMMPLFFWVAGLFLAEVHLPILIIVQNRKRCEWIREEL